MSENRISLLRTTMYGLAVIAVMVAVVYASTVARFFVEPGIGTPEQVLARIAPIGSVSLAAGGGTAAAEAPIPAPAQDEGPGAVIYNKACATCHATGVAEAPKLGDEAAWKPRLAQGVDQLLQTAIGGKGAMPPRGTCLDCSDDDLKVAIEYMLGQVGYEPAASSASADAPANDEGTGAGSAPVTDGTSGPGGMPAMPGS